MALMGVAIVCNSRVQLLVRRGQMLIPQREKPTGRGALAAAKAFAASSLR